MRSQTRRSVLKLVGASAAAAAVPASANADDGWQVAETPVDGTLHDVCGTATNPHSVGDGGLIVERTADGWELVLRGGPTGNGNDLYGADTTDDGEGLWVVGASGAIGEYDVVTGNLVDRSAPNQQTGNFNDVAVTGPAGDADVYVADDSGSIHYSFENGEDGTWEYETPGSGDALPGIDFHAERSGHAIDTNGRVYATDDGVTWSPIGVENADVTFYGLDGDAPDDVWVSGGNATVLEHDGSQWRSESLGDAALRDVEVDGDAGYAVGGGGTVFEHVGGRWRRNDTPTGENLNAVLRSDAIDLATGSGGAVIER